MPDSSARKRIEEVTAIYEISQAIGNTQIDDLLRLITEKAAAVMDAQACSLMLKDPHRDEMVIKASFGLSVEIVEETRVAYGEGIAGRVAQSGEPMLLTNLRDDPRFAGAEITPRPDIVSSICVPLKDEEGGVNGVLSIRRISPASEFTGDDVKLFSVFASQAALAISNARLYQSLKDRVQELSSLYEMSNDLSNAYSLENAVGTLVRLAAQVTGDVSSMLLLMDGRSDSAVRVWSSSSVPARLRRSVPGMINDEAIAWLHRHREPRSLVAGAGGRWPESLRPLADALGKSFSRINLVPLVAEDAVIGVLMLGSNGRPPEKRRIRLLSIVASQAASIIKNASRYEEQIEQKSLELSALYQLSERISTAGSPKEAFDSILDIVRGIVWYDESFIYTVDYDRSLLVEQACRSVETPECPAEGIPLDGDSVGSWAIRERKALVSRDVRRDPRFRSLESMRGRAVRSLMAIPLIVQDEVVGVLSVHSYAPNAYTEENVKILSVIASQAAALYKELEALAALASYTDNILRSIAAGVLTLDREGRVLTWNKAAEDITSIYASDVTGLHFSDVVEKLDISPADRARTADAVRRVLDSGQKYLGYKLEYHGLDGNVAYINMNIAQLRDHVGEMLGVVIIFEDVTREISMENEMRRISELAAIGQLAASIAHELRNPLSSIKGAAQYIRNEYEDHATMCEFLDIIIEEVNVLNRIATEFLDFARPTRFNLRETDVNDVLFRLLQFMQMDISKSRVEVEQNLAYDVPRVVADDKQIEQVFRNIILNAIQAMPEGGRLSVVTSAEPDGVQIAVSDTGIGIAEEHQPQIFVPFFTTRTKGTGLGLAIVNKIVENHGGRIGVQSRVGEGTTFRIFLPLCGDRARAALEQAESAVQMGEEEYARRGQRPTDG
ncbi:MAG: GAF domain-containing protein [Armatimonadetes bacterium]|nr:GAF domain-containing protein [Armatimonadota bacterium]